MSLASRLASLISAIGADVKSLQTQINALDAPWTYLRVTGSNVTNNTTSLSDVTGLTTGTGLAAGTYEIEGKILFTSAAATTAAYFSLIYPAQINPGVTIEVAEGAFNFSTYHVVATGVLAGGAAAPAANKNLLARVSGFFVVSGAMASTMKLQFRSEVASSTITVKPPSYIRYRKVL